MVSPQNFIFRKRKQRPPSSLSLNPVTGRFTRSKTQSLLHRSRSGRAWSGRYPFPQQSHLMIDNLLKNPRKMHQRLDGIEASPYISVEKKCSGRGRTNLRVSTVLSSKGVVREKESDGLKIKQELGGKGRSSRELESDVHLDSNQPEPNNEQIKNSKDSVVGWLAVGCGEQLDKEGRSSKDKNSCCLDKRNAPKSGNRLGKVFKAPASFNYRRLLPYLTEMAKNNPESSLPSTLVMCGAGQHVYAKENSDSDIQLEEKNNIFSGFQLHDLGDPSDCSALTGGQENSASYMQLECINSQDSGAEERGLEDPSNSLAQTGVRENTDSDMQLECKNSQDSVFEHPVAEVDLEEPSNSWTRTGVQNEVFTAVQANNDNFTEECVQTTPPDPAILSKFDIGDRRKHGERNKPYIEIQLIGLKPPNISCKEYVCDAVNSQQSPIKKSNSSPKTKPFLNQCSGMKIFKTPSISYRRLLPYLMDVAKGASNNDLPPPMLENNSLRSSESLSSPSYGEDVSVNRRGLNDLCAEKEASNGGTIATCESPSVEPNMQICVQLEQTVNEEAKTDVQLPCHSKTTLTNRELNCSMDKSISITKIELQPVEEPISVALENKPENGCRRHLNNSSSPENDIEIHTSVKGILKRNPRGCRGLCNCLNCSSFRLHAERSFDFSRNQLLDAEEVAFGLIDELTTLRNILEKNVDNGCAFKCNQVKEACRKAIIREQVSKQRLTMMNEELNVHQRHAPLLRPSVTFSERIEERAISKANKCKNSMKKE